MGALTLRGSPRYPSILCSEQSGDRPGVYLGRDRRAAGTGGRSGTMLRPPGADSGASLVQDPARRGRTEAEPARALPPRRAAGARGRLASSVTSSVRLPSCQNRGCLFHSSSQSTKGERGFNACVWTQAIIPNYCFSFEPARPAGEPADEHALILPSRLISVGFAGQTGREGFVAFISM